MYRNGQEIDWSFLLSSPVSPLWYPDRNQMDYLCRSRETEEGIWLVHAADGSLYHCPGTVSPGMKFWRRIPMRYKMIIGLALLVGILFLWGRNLQAQVHVSDKSTISCCPLLSPGVPAVSVDSIEHGKYLCWTQERNEFGEPYRECHVGRYDDFDLKEWPVSVGRISGCVLLCRLPK